MSRYDHSTATPVRQPGNTNRRWLLHRGLVSAGALTLAVAASPTLLHAQAQPEVNPPSAVSNQGPGAGQGPRDGRRARDGERTRDGKRVRDGERRRGGERTRDGQRPGDGQRPHRGGARQR